MSEDKDFLLYNVMSKHTFIELVVGFIGFTIPLFMNQIDALIPQFYYAYKIPVHTIGIVISKLFSSRSVSLIIGSLIQYLIIAHFPGQIFNYNLLAYGLFFSMRMLNMFLIYSDLSLMSMYVLYNAEAFCTGFFLTSFLAFVTDLMPVLLLGSSVSVSFAFLIQRLIKHVYRGKPIMMFKVQGWISLAASCIGFGAFIYYSHFYHKFKASYKDTINKIKSSIDTFDLIMKDIKNNSSAVYFYVSLLKTLDNDVKSLFGNVEQLKSLKGITTEPKIMDSILEELKDKVKDLLDFIEFGTELRDKKLYDIKIFLKTKPFEQLIRFKNINKTWEGIKAHQEWAKNNFMFKYKTPINYNHSENGKPKATTAPVKVQSTTDQTPKTTGLKPSLKPEELSSFGLQTTPKPTTEVYSGDNGSANGQQISGQNGSEEEYHYYSGSGVDYTYSGIGLEPTEQPSGQEPEMRAVSPKNEETQTTEATTTAKSETATESPLTVTEATTIEPVFLPVKTEKPSILTQKTTTAHQKATTILHPESGSTEMKKEVPSNNNSQDTKLNKNQPQPIIVRPTFETDKLDSKMDQIVKDLGTLADKVILAYNTIKKADARKQDDKTKCLELVYEAESLVLDMDCRMNEIYRALTDSLRYDHNVKFNNLKHIHIVHQKDTTKLLQSGEEMKKVFERNKDDIISPILMFFVASLIKDFLFPSILPYAFMQIYINDMILLAVIIEVYSSILVLIIERLATEFRNWNKAYDTFWIMAAPLIAILLTSILALNTNLQGIRAFYRSDTKVLLATISILVFASILKQLSYVGVANYVYYQSGDVLGNAKYLLSYHLGAIAFRFVVCKLAIKTEPKVNLGFRFPNLPIQQNPGTSCLLLWLKSGIKSSLKEAFGDFATNIWRYT